MKKEIERKFLVKDDSWRQSADEGRFCAQGYLCKENGITVRVRIMDGCGYLTLKSETVGISRDEFEYEIPEDDAHALLKRCDCTIAKRRYYIPQKEFLHTSGIIIVE